jgi:hypothetical protein
MEEEKTMEEENVVEEEEAKDPNTWYPINNGQTQYKGEWKNGVPHGKGTNEIFEGEYKDAEGKPCDSNGKSCCWCLFECDFVDGRIEGYGKQTFKQEGEATQPYYEGEFKNGMQHGQGAYYYGTGEYHKGNFKENKFHGVGYHYYVKVNKTWVGEFDNDKLTKGRFIDGKIDDEYEDYEFDEYEFRGEQLRRLRAYNKKNENETEDEYTKRILDMAYNEDKEKKMVASLKKEEKVAEKDINTWHTIEDGKARYKGEWKNGLPNGKGIKHCYKSDSYLEGNFVDGFLHGYGKQTFQQTWEKTVPYYEGEFKRNQFEGKGEYHYGDGDYYKGMWKNSKYHGQGAAYSLQLNRTWVGEYFNDEKVNGDYVKGEI